jgi:WD40 repeat protein
MRSTDVVGWISDTELQKLLQVGEMVVSDFGILAFLSRFLHWNLAMANPLEIAGLSPLVIAFQSFSSYSSPGNSFSDEERCIVAGYDNGDIKLFDLRANSIRFETNVSNGVTSVEFDRKDIEMNKMVVTTLESKFRLFDMRTQHPTGSS